MQLSIIIPILNEESIIDGALQALNARILSTGRPDDIEVIVVDGGSRDKSAAMAGNHADHVLTSVPGRACQMNSGAAVATGRYLLFLHLDTALPEDFLNAMPLSGGVPDKQPAWGFFTVRLSGKNWRYRIIEYGIHLRSKLTHVASGDQCIFIKRSVFNQLGGFANIPLMEDIEISKRLRRIAVPVMVKQAVITSSRRWQTHGALKTVLFMWWLRWCYFLGTSPRKLAKKYYGPTG